MVDDEEWEWIVEHATGDFDHLLVATTIPWLLSPGFHHLEAWSERVCDGAWGDAAATPRRASCAAAVDFDHWASFGEVLRTACGDLLEEVGTGKRGKPPASIVVLSGDVHHAYLAEVGFKPGDRHRRPGLPGGLLALPQPARRQGAGRDQGRIQPPVHRLDAGACARARALRTPRSAGACSTARTSTIRSRHCASTAARAVMQLDKTEPGEDEDRELVCVFERRLA